MDKEMDYSAMTKDEKGEIFEYVNSFYLHLKGDKKKFLKRSFTSTWKQNKTIGAFELFMELYKSCDKVEKSIEHVEEEIKYVGLPLDWATKTVSWRRHKGMTMYMNEEYQALMDQIEELEDHSITMKEHSDVLKEQRKSIEREYEDKIRALEKEVQRERFRREKDIRSAEMEGKRLALLLQSEKAISEIKASGMNM